MISSLIAIYKHIDEEDTLMGVRDYNFGNDLMEM